MLEKIKENLKNQIKYRVVLDIDEAMCCRPASTEITKLSAYKKQVDIIKQNFSDVTLIDWCYQSGYKYKLLNKTDNDPLEPGVIGLKLVNNEKFADLYDVNKLLICQVGDKTVLCTTVEHYVSYYALRDLIKEIEDFFEQKTEFIITPYQEEKILALVSHAGLIPPIRLHPEYIGLSAAHCFFPDYEKLILVVLSWGWSIDFFSSGVEARNKEVLWAYLITILSKYSKNIEKDLITIMDSGRLQIFSRHHLKRSQLLEQLHPDSLRDYETGSSMKKDLTVISSDLANTIIVDDDRSYIVADEQLPFIGLSHTSARIFNSMMTRSDVWQKIKFSDKKPEIVKPGFLYIYQDNLSIYYITKSELHGVITDIILPGELDSTIMSEIITIIQTPTKEISLKIKIAIHHLIILKNIFLYEEHVESSGDMMCHPYGNAAYVMGILLDCKEKIEQDGISLREALDFTLRRDDEAKEQGREDRRNYTPWYWDPMRELGCDRKHEKLIELPFYIKMSRWIKNGLNCFADISLGEGS